MNAKIATEPEVMLPQISFVFPNTSPEAREFFDYLSKILAELPNARHNSTGLTIAATKPATALPVTMFTQASSAFPEVYFGDDSGLQLSLGNLQVNPVSGGESVAVQGVASPSGLSINEVYGKLAGHIIRLDHTGLNIPTAIISRAQWDKFTARVAAKTNLYAYPTGEPWLFIVPATQQEFKAGITEFGVGREPRFELVHDAYNDVPSIQIDIETNLTRPEVEKLFPAPFGISFPGLADYFRTVYLRHMWPGLAIRVDIRFKNRNPQGDWETGKWLVEDGGRVSGVARPSL